MAATINENHKHTSPLIKKYNPVNRPYIVDADEFKKQAQDFDTDNHHIYSNLAKIDLEQAIKYNHDDTVVHTAGGSGSFKTEGIVNQLIDNGFLGVINDGTFSRIDKVREQFSIADKYLKQNIVIANLPTIEKALSFVDKRHEKTGRHVPLSIFTKKHNDFIYTMLLAIEEFPKVKFYLNNYTDISNPNLVVNKNEIVKILKYSINKEIELKTTYVNLSSTFKLPKPIFPANIYEEYGVDWRQNESKNTISSVENNPLFVKNLK